MFQIEPSPETGFNGDHKYVIDHDRGAWLQRIAGHGPDSGELLQLRWRGKSIPFDTTLERRTDGSGAEYTFVQFLSFGGTNVSPSRGGLPSVEFDSDQERDEAMGLAAEALLVYGDNYDGLAKAEGHYRVQCVLRTGEARIVTLATFGYEGRIEPEHRPLPSI